MIQPPTASPSASTGSAPGPGTPSGFDLYRRSRNLGEIEEVITLGRHHYYVIDARHWSYGTRKLLPVAAVTDIDPASRRAHTDADLDDLRSSPDFEPFLLGDERYATRVERYFADRFGPQWAASG